VQLLQEVPFIPQDQRKLLFDIENTLKRNIRLTANEKQKLQEIPTKFGFIIQLSN